MTTGHWLEVAIGFVVPTAAVIWGVWILWRGFRPGGFRRPSGWLAGVIGFLLTCVLVILIVLAWEMFKVWKRPGAQGSVGPGPATIELCATADGPSSASPAA